MKAGGAGMLIWIVLGLVVAAVAYVRLAPIDLDRWHVPVTATADKNGTGNAVRIIPAGEGVMARLDNAMMAEPATSRIAGSVAEGHVTYVSRSKWWGFPDFTTIQQVDDEIRMFARLRFGASDFGVNAKRLERLKRAVQARG